MLPLKSENMAVYIQFYLVVLVSSRQLLGWWVPSAAQSRTTTKERKIWLDSTTKWAGHVKLSISILLGGSGRTASSSGEVFYLTWDCTNQYVHHAGAIKLKVRSPEITPRRPQNDKREEGAKSQTTWGHHMCGIYFSTSCITGFSYIKDW